jgi:thiol-disulfide isomerase/thioredoxin
MAISMLIGGLPDMASPGHEKGTAIGPSEHETMGQSSQSTVFSHAVVVDGVRVVFQVMGLEGMKMEDPEGNTHHMMVKFFDDTTRDRLEDLIGKIKVISPEGSDQVAKLKNYGGVFAANFTFKEKGKYGVICLFKMGDKKHLVKFWYQHGANELPPPVLPAPSHAYIRGQADYDWTLESLDGNKVAFSEFENKVVFLNFWATWCPPCTVELPSIRRLYESFKNNGEVAFVVATYEDEKIVQKFISSHKLRLPVYLHKRNLPTVFESKRGIPITFIIDRNGGIVYEQVGAAKWDDEAVVSFLRSLL